MIIHFCLADWFIGYSIELVYKSLPQLAAWICSVLAVFTQQSYRSILNLVVPETFSWTFLDSWERDYYEKE